MQIAEHIYKGCGKVWVGIDSQGVIKAIEYMDRCEYGRAFGEYRKECRGRIEAQGLQVITGTAGGFQFMPNFG